MVIDAVATAATASLQHPQAERARAFMAFEFQMCVSERTKTIPSATYCTTAVYTSSVCVCCLVSFPIYLCTTPRPGAPRRPPSWACTSPPTVAAWPAQAWAWHHQLPPSPRCRPPYCCVCCRLSLSLSLLGPSSPTGDRRTGGQEDTKARRNPFVAFSALSPPLFLLLLLHAVVGAPPHVTINTYSGLCRILLSPHFF